MIRRPPSSTLFPHDALPISIRPDWWPLSMAPPEDASSTPLFLVQQENARRACSCTPPLMTFIYDASKRFEAEREDRKSTRLNSSHANISYAVFCLKKKNKTL